MKNTFFRLPFLFCIVVIAALLWSTLYFSTTVSDEDQAAYDRLAKEILDKHLLRKKDVEKEVTKQVRVDVQKSFLFLPKQNPCHIRVEFRLKADKSELKIYQKKAGARVVEVFTNPKCFIQEELYYVSSDGNKTSPDEANMQALLPKQLLRYIEADFAEYDFQTKKLVATKARFWTYIVDGHQIPDHVEHLIPLEKGSARTMTMNYSQDSGVQFASENLIMESL